MKSFVVVVVTVIVLVSVIHVAHAGRVTVPVVSTAFQSHSSADTAHGEYYTLSFSVPQELDGKTLMSATLVFGLDVSTREIDGITLLTSVLEVYPLTSAFVDETSLENKDSKLSVRRVVSTGSDRRVSLDITGIVDYYRANPSKNYGLMLGSISDSREGLFSVLTDTFGAGKPAEITFIFAEKR